MPFTPDNTPFANASNMAAANADPFLKEISMEADETAGHVEGPTGWVAKMLISRDDVAEWVSREGDPWMSEKRNFEPGWYLIQINNHGIVWGYFYETEAKADEDFAKVGDLHTEWDLDPIDDSIFAPREG